MLSRFRVSFSASYLFSLISRHLNVIDILLWRPTATGTGTRTHESQYFKVREGMETETKDEEGKRTQGKKGKPIKRGQKSKHQTAKPTCKDT